MTENDECDCIIPKHWPKNVEWAHRDGCAKKARLIEALRERWSRC